MARVTKDVYTFVIYITGRTYGWGAGGEGCLIIHCATRQDKEINVNDC